MYKKLLKLWKRWIGYVSCQQVQIPFWIDNFSFFFWKGNLWVFLRVKFGWGSILRGTKWYLPFLKTDPKIELEFPKQFPRPQGFVTGRPKWTSDLNGDRFFTDLWSHSNAWGIYSHRIYVWYIYLHFHNKIQLYKFLGSPTTIFSRFAKHHFL